jgi:transposase
MLHFTKQQTMAKNKLRLELTKVAPEIEQTIDNLGGPQILAWLQHFPTAHDMAKASTQRLHDVRYGTRGRALPSTYIKKMQALAQNSIAYKNGPTAGLIVLALVRHIRHLQQEIQQIKQHIRKLYLEIQDHDSLLTTITGIGKETAIVLEAYIGDVNRFPNAKKIVAYFGMNPVVNLSGKVTKRNSYLEKKGSGRVRHKLFMAVLHIIQMREGPIYAFYKRLVAAGKPKLVALIAAMRKLLVIIYAMLKTQQPFDANHT